MNRLIITTLALVCPSFGCRQHAEPIPSPERRYELPRGDRWDALSGDWDVTGLILKNGARIGRPGTTIEGFLGLSGMRVDAEAITLERLGGGEYRATWRVISHADPIALHLRSEDAETSGDQGAIVTGSGSRLVICFSLLKAPVGGAVAYPERFETVTDETLCVEFSRR